MQNDIKPEFLVTENQFRAISQYISICKAPGKSLNDCKAILTPSRFHDPNQPEIEKWLRNAWNTERAILIDCELLNEDMNFFMIQWLLVKAYYSAFYVSVAYLKCINSTETSHAAVRATISRLFDNGTFPYYLSATVSGNIDKPVFKRISLKSVYQPLRLIEYRADIVETHFAKALETTRDQMIKEKRMNLKAKFKTKSGITKKSLTADEWDEVSKLTPATSILDYLYRKRIKSNYQDNTMMDDDGLSGKTISLCVKDIINEYLLAFEAAIIRSTGKRRYIDLFVSRIPHSELAAERYEKILQRINL